MRTPILLILAFAVTAPAHAQSTADNFAKYLALRERLVRDYIAQGTGPGMGIPASDRRPSIMRIRWGDATIRLGWSIALFATELGLLDEAADYPGLELDRTSAEQQLFEALSALERLDRVGDASFPAPCLMEPALNGFFIRDDVPADLHEAFEGMDAVASDFLDFETQKEMSQDQVHHLMIGLSLVRRYVDEDLRVQGRPLREWAREMAERILRHVVEGEDPYRIANPACDRLVARGANAQAYAPGIVKMAPFVTGGAFAPTDVGAVSVIWDLGRDPESGVFARPDNLHMGMAIAAIGRGWDDTTIGDLRALAEIHGWEVYPLLARALHGDDAGFCEHGAALNERARAMLDELPLGAEPVNPRPEVAMHGWTTSSRFIRPREQHYVGAEDSEGFEFNGLDYLLLHNLYYLATPAEWEGGSGEGVPQCPPPMPDAGLPDAGAVDAGGTDMGSDAPADVGFDAMGDAGADGGGCSCRAHASSRPSLVWLGLLLFVGVRAVRRRTQ